jgi:SAM-dependent methyltransferase
MDWSDGYLVELDYTSGYFRRQSPAHLAIACALAGFVPVDTIRPFTCFELGSGHGLTANVLAASNPQARFFTADFMPSHVAAARALAEAAQLGNVTHLENSFAELAAGQVELPPLDIVTMHGVYSWVAPETRRQIVEFARRCLKPGGMLYVSYNAMPGWSAATPLQRLVFEFAQARPGAPIAQIEEARALIERMDAADAAYFRINEATVLQSRLASWATDRPAYLAHEYLNRSWQALYHADVVRDFAPAKLDYVASAELLMNLPDSSLSPAQRELLAGVVDPVLRETLRDYLHNAAFRSDIFVRGARRLDRIEAGRWRERVGIALTVPRASATLGQPAGDPPGPAFALPMLDALAERPRTLAELGALPGQSPASVFKLLAMLSWNDQGTAYRVDGVDAGGGTRDAARRLNLAIARQSVRDDRYQALASPLLAAGAGASLLQRLVYLALQDEAGPPSPAALSEWIWQTLSEQGPPIILDDKEAGTREEALAEIGRAVSAILEQRVPVWRQLQVLP